MFIYQGKKITAPLQIHSVNYTPDWFAQASPEQLAELGVIYAPDPALPDPLMYDYYENADGSLTLLPLSSVDIALRLASYVAGCCAHVDADVDKIYADAVGNRISEYQLAKDQATAYQAAGYSGTVPETVQKWATLSGQSAHWAADDILAQAAALLAAQLSIRDNRLTVKTQLRAAANQTAADALIGAWAGYVVAIRASLGV